MILTLLMTTVTHAETWSNASRQDRWDFSIMTRYSWSKDYTDDSGSTINFDINDILRVDLGFLL
jgi:hypothetical protein